MKWLLGAGAALVATTLLIGTIDLYDSTDRRPADVRRERTLAVEVRQAQAALREAVYLDSLLPLLPAEPGVRVAVPPSVARVVAAGITGSAAAQLAGMAEVRARTGVFVVPASMGTHPRLDNRASMRYTYYAGNDDVGAYCFVVAAAHLPADSLLSRFDGLSVTPNSAPEPLGPCFYWARYGAPGGGMQQWLRESGYRFAERREVRTSGRDVRPAQRRIFGLRDVSERSVFGDACLAGAKHACARAFTSHEDNLSYGRLPPDALPVYERRAWGGVAFGRAEHALLGDIERAFGPDRFAEFWRSDQAVDAAFAHAFDVPLGDWVRQWAALHYPAAQPLRASPDLWTVLLSLLTVSALCGAALLQAHHRQL